MSTFLMRGHWGQLSGLHLDVVHNCCCLQWHWPWQCWHKASYVSGDEEVESTCRPMKAWLKKKKKDFIRFHFPWIYFKILFALSCNNVKVTLHKKRQWMWPISVLKAIKITWQKTSFYQSKNYVLHLLILLTLRLSGKFVWIMKFFEAFLIMLS